MNKKVVIAVGGTGGHIYPALALAEQLSDIIPSSHLLFLGGKLSDNRFFNKTFHYQSIACGSLVKKDPLALIRNTYGIAKGTWQSLKIMKSFQTDLVIGFGSYHSFPPLVAAKLAAIPFILHEANTIPGKVIRLLSKHAKVTGTHFPTTAALLKGKTSQVGMPLRDGYQRSAISHRTAMEYFQLDAQWPTLLMFGGSQGAKTLNTYFPKALRKTQQNLQVLHFTGDAATTRELSRFYQEHQISAVVKEFELRMDLAWQVADLVISRSGASAIAELIEFEVPAILIPYPHAADNHQEYNADFLAQTMAGGIKLLEKELDEDKLAQAINHVLSHKKKMQSAIQTYKKKCQHGTLLDLVKTVLLEV